MVMNSTIPNGVFQYLHFRLEYINESSNIVNQITNTGTVTFTSSPTTIDFYRSYCTNSGFVCWTAPVNQNGVRNCYQWLAPNTNYI